MDDKLKATIDKVVRLTQQNAEFGKNLKKALEIVPSLGVSAIDDERFDQIYEYCIEKVVIKQANEFYKNFPIKSIIPSLIADYTRMEAFRRKDNFGDFCLALYQQIECISNSLCEDEKLSYIAEKMWGYPAYVKAEQGNEVSYKNRPTSSYTIANLVFWGNTNGTPNAIAKSKQSIQTLYAMDKVRTIIYFVCFKAKMKNSDYDNYVEITSSINEIYQCRNMNHRGNTQTRWEKETLTKITPLQSYYYFKFMGVLAQFVNDIKEGMTTIDELEEYAKSLEEKKVQAPGPKIIDKIDLKDDGRKRFR